jgi:hypothetical protein
VQLVGGRQAREAGPYDHNRRLGAHRHRASAADVKASGPTNFADGARERFATNDRFDA